MLVFPGIVLRVTEPGVKNDTTAIEVIWEQRPLTPLLLSFALHLFHVISTPALSLAQERARDKVDPLDQFDQPTVMREQIP